MMDISKLTHHTKWTELNIEPYQGIATLIFQANGIPVTHKQTIQGIGIVRIEFTLDRLKDYDRALRLESQMRAGYDLDGVTMIREGSTIAVEVPCKADTLYVGDMLANPGYTATDRFNVAIGRTTTGKDVFADLEELKHILVAGTSGSGKSVFLQSLLLSIIGKHSEDAEIYILDPKMVEFNKYKVCKPCTVVTEISEAASLLSDLCNQMEERYRAMTAAGVRDIDSYNDKFPHGMKRIIFMVDELGDLMKQAKRETEPYLVRLAQKARACGIHLIPATQYPTKDIVTGAIKQNMPTKVCFAVPTTTASVVMLGKKGAEMLRGKGDMYFQTEKDIRPIRVQGAFATDNDIDIVIGENLKHIEYIYRPLYVGGGITA
jgi:S-DNA-T family DNA segregation ATPase FtsK/SpoIIIE